MELREIASRAPELARRSSHWLSTRRQRRRHAAEPHEVRSSITVGQPADVVYRRLLEPETLSALLAHFVRVEAVDGGRLHWHTERPVENLLEGEIAVQDKDTGRRIVWRSTASALPHETTVELTEAPGERGTEVRVIFRPLSIGGKLAQSALDLFDHAPELLAMKALRRFKSLVETGEIPTLAHNPAGKPRAVHK